MNEVSAVYQSEFGSSSYQNEMKLVQRNFYIA